MQIFTESNQSGHRLSIADTHAHLDMKEFDKDRDEVIARAKDAGVDMIVNVGTDLAASRKAVKLAEMYPQIFAAVGFHPHEVTNVTEPDIASLSALTNNPRVVAIGEIGLDYYRKYSNGSWDLPQDLTCLSSSTADRRRKKCYLF
jgi:TatD DNase family protein